MSSGQQITEEKFVEENIRAEEAITNGNLPEAARILVSVVEQDPENWRAFNSFGIISWAQKYWLDAFAMFKKSVSINPVYSDALINLFDASLKLRKVEEALPYFEKALQVNPDLGEIRIIRDSIVQQGQDIYTSKRALSIGFYSPLIEEAEKELEAGNLFKAMELFLRANDVEGPSAKAFCGLGIISYYQKRYQDAFTLFLESIKLNPSDPDTYLNLLDAAKECDLVGDAIKVYQAYRPDFSSLESISEEFESAVNP
ncbi:MAG TPA: tetratricopeptide repeat protein [Chitinispirillaceae bacterium]|jgi:tetratricopeptide (TPR) repeat protein|nr:tetratricopeptide repeat protein [Chitinispirillaceae bacterium]